MKWIECDNYEKLPIGEWLVKVEDDRHGYHVANVAKNSSDQKLIIVGNHFDFDMQDLIAYSEFDRFEPPTK